MSDRISRRAEYLQALDVDLWVRRQPRSAPESVATSPAAVIADLDWGDLERRVAACTRCALHAGRTQTVFGVGARDARLMVIGEGPGAGEDRQGEPFVGRAGQLLNAMLKAMGLARADVYIANIVKCRPPQNRDPRPEEAGSCLPYLERQIALVDPQVILCVGRVAAQNLLGTDAPLARLRGRVESFGVERRPVVVTYHPAYLLRTPRDKAKAWIDLVRALDLMGAAAAQAR
jgi:uracil-DNA glycosylase